MIALTRSLIQSRPSIESLRRHIAATVAPRGWFVVRSVSDPPDICEWLRGAHGVESCSEPATHWHLLHTGVHPSPWMPRPHLSFCEQHACERCLLKPGGQAQV